MRAVVELHIGRLTIFIFDIDVLEERHEVHFLNELLVLFPPGIALGRARVVVEGYARADDVEKRRAVMREGSLQKGHDLLRVTGEGPSHIGRAELDGETAQIDCGKVVHNARLERRAKIRGRGELAFREPVNAVVLDDVNDGEVPAQEVDELADPNRRRIAIAGDADGDEVAVRENSTGRNGRHAAVHGVETMALAQPIGRCFRRAANARELRHLMRLDAIFVEGFDELAADRVVPAAFAQRGRLSFVVHLREPQAVDLPFQWSGRLCRSCHGLISQSRCVSVRPREARTRLRGVFQSPIARRSGVRHNSKCCGAC